MMAVTSAHMAVREGRTSEHALAPASERLAWLAWRLSLLCWGVPVFDHCEAPLRCARVGPPSNALAARVNYITPLVAGPDGVSEAAQARSTATGATKMPILRIARTQNPARTHTHVHAT